MVNKWDGFEPDQKDISAKPVNASGEESGPRIIGSPTVVKFKAFADDPLPQPTVGDRNWGAFVLILALVFAFLFGAMAQALFHII